jgi:hypothetical protein
MVCAAAQTPYPPAYIRNVVWDADAHYITVPQPIISPGYELEPTTITGTTVTEFISATEVRLTPGFHAGGFSGEGRFRAWINEGLGDPSEVIVIAPDNAIEPTDNMVHVPKWEKLEVGLKLPEDFQEAIDRFYDHYYLPNDPYQAVPGNVDDLHDLNPYADDSLLLVMRLTSPSGVQSMKWGFFMREARFWPATNPLANLAEDVNDPLYPYHIRFRIAPDEEGPWQFSIAIQAPHTATLNDEPLAAVIYNGYGFVCDAPLPDNNGYLEVNTNNDRYLQFQGDKTDPNDQTPFFALGTNMADVTHFYGDLSPNTYRLNRQAFDDMSQMMDALHDVGGNFMRMFLMRHLFAPEWVNLGVYDKYKSLLACPGGTAPTVTGSGQYSCWAFDQLLDHARANDIYLQLCIDPYPPIVAYESLMWSAHPYYLNYLEPNLNPAPGPTDNRFQMKQFFYEDGDPANKDVKPSVFYYWKRRYKYIMARWGYSVNFAIIEPFNEIDQMLGYSYRDLRPDANGQSPLCPDNRLEWHAEDGLRSVLNDWITDIADFVRNPVDLQDPAGSSLGEEGKLFLMSYAGGDPEDEDYHLPFTNPAVDLIDAHRAMDWEWTLRYNVEAADRYHGNFQNKPFHHGEFTTYGDYSFPLPPAQPVFEYASSAGIFDNYDVSFHNELWASTFSGSFGAGTTWAWNRVFYKDRSPQAFADDQLNIQGWPYSNSLGAVNQLWVGNDPNGARIYAEVENRALNHHFKPLSDFLGKPSVQALGLFTENYTPHVIDANGIECFYLLNETKDLAVGWVHNANAYWRRAFYINALYQDYADCPSPIAQSIALEELDDNTTYYISYFPTRMNTTECPADEQQVVGLNEQVTLHIDNPETAAFNGHFPLATTGTLRNHLDTLHSDYAFIVSTGGFVKSLRLPMMDTTQVDGDWDFTLYPNPAREEVHLRFNDDTPKEVTILDPFGRRVRTRSGISQRLYRLETGGLASGAYWIRVSDGTHSTSKKLLIH